MVGVAPGLSKNTIYAQETQIAGCYSHDKGKSRRMGTGITQGFQERFQTAFLKIDTETKATCSSTSQYVQKTAWPLQSSVGVSSQPSSGWVEGLGQCHL